MAISYSHTFGQIIGDLLEAAVEPSLQSFADNNELFLDRKGERQTRKGKKLTWVDVKENKHDLDFVLERGGTDLRLGTPVAFIETAWRRYTKHSRNKAQEIQGAILPLLAKYSYVSPFAGVVLAGEFTKGSLTQLASQGFTVLYFSYDSVMAAFENNGIDANFDEDTSEEDFRIKLDSVRKLENLSVVAQELMRINSNDVTEFFQSLEQAISRRLESIIIWPLHGMGTSIHTLEEAVAFLNDYLEDRVAFDFIRYEIVIKYNTGTIINATCANKQEAVDFLERNAG